MPRHAHPCPTMDAMTSGVIEHAVEQWAGHLRAVGMVRNVDARRVGRNAGIHVGWGPTIMACVLLAFSVLWVLLWLSGAFG